MDSQQTQILKVVAGMFNAAAGKELLGVMTVYANTSDVQSLAVALAATPVFQSEIVEGTDAEDVAALMDNFGFVADSDPLSAGSLAQTYITDRIAAGDDYGVIVFNIVTFLSLPAADLPAIFTEAATLLNNKAAVSLAFSEEVSSTDLATMQSVFDTVDGVDPITDAEIDAIVTPYLPPGDSYTLTNTTDIATANIFNAPMVFTPDGSDRILSLQDEDVLTGTAGRVDNTLNAVMGNWNADEGFSIVVTPKLLNIQNLNVEWTGNTTVLDTRNADSLDKIHIDRVTADAGAVMVDNITTAAADLRVKDAASDDTSIVFNYQRGVLSGSTDEANIELDDVLAANIMQNARGPGFNVEGFETVNLNAINGVDINGFSVNETENLKITGDSFLDVVQLTPTVPGLAGVSAPEFQAIGVAGGFDNPGAPGFRTIDASEFLGDLAIDVTNAVGGFSDPLNSGSPAHTVITGGSGDDTFYTRGDLTSTTSTNRDELKGGAGANKLVSTGGIVTNTTNSSTASITDIQSLELRQQGAAQIADLAAFDSALTNVLVRDENSNAAAAAFTLNNMLATTEITLNHGVSEFALPQTDAQQLANAVTVATVVNVNLDDAAGTDDTVVLNVANDLNTGLYFNYTLNADGDNGDGDKILTDGVVENVTVNDNDTESNILTLANFVEHTGTVKLTGGADGQSYTVASTLIAKTIDGSAQLSDLRLSVGDTTAPIATITQDIKLGAGDDILTFENVDDFDSTDKLSDVGGTDIVRAAFNKDSTLSLTGIEGLHIVANNNVTLNMASADVTTLVVLSDGASDASGDKSPLTPEPFNVTPTAAQVITLSNTNLTTLNFFADLDTDDDNTDANQIIADNAGTAAGNATGQAPGTAIYEAAYDAAYKATINDEDTTQIWNGVTLANNTSPTLDVVINSNLDDVIYGATAYTIGQLTAHGVTTMNINVSDEDDTAIGTELNPLNALTTINNIFAKNMQDLTITAAENVTLGTVSGAALNNSLKKFDASNVGGAVTANVISLGNNAVVTLANGNHVFNALGSAGNNVTITSGNGTSTITGTGQTDTITTGTGWDTISGDRGNNVITSGAGNDAVTAKDGNDTVDLGTGIDSFIDNSGTALNGSLATNTVSMSGGVATFIIDVTGNNTAGVDTILGTLDDVLLPDPITLVNDVHQMLAVGNGSDLTISALGGTLNAATAVLDGRLASLNGAIAADANSNLEIDTLGAVVSFSGGAGNDVYIVANNAATAVASAVDFSGGTGNDAGVRSTGTDLFNGGVGADNYVMQNSTVLDGNADVVTIVDGDSKASAWDIIVGFDATGVAIATPGAAAVAGTNVGDDKLNLDDATIAAAFAAGVDGTNTTGIQTHVIGANGVITFGSDDTDAIFNDDAVAVGTANGQVTLADAIAYVTANITVPGTVMFNYDANGDGFLTAVDSTFVYQNGTNDTLVELVGTYTGLEAAAGVTPLFIEIV